MFQYLLKKAFIIILYLTVPTIMSFQKIIHGSFNQGHSMFGESAGKQCACISLYAASFTTHVKQPGRLVKPDIDILS